MPFILFGQSAPSSIIPTAQVGNSFFSQPALSMIKYLIRALPAPVNVFSGGWYTLQNPVQNIPTTGTGQNFRLDDRYYFCGIDYLVQIFLSAFGANIPTQCRILTGFYRKLSSQSFVYTDNLNNDVSEQLNDMTPGGASVALTAPIVSTSNLTILDDRTVFLNQTLSSLHLPLSFMCKYYNIMNNAVTGDNSPIDGIMPFVSIYVGNLNGNSIQVQQSMKTNFFE